jgi:hypothetical protein
VNLELNRANLNAMATDVLAVCAIDFDSESQLNQALVGTFIFGMIFADSMLHRLQPPEVHALALAVFADSLHYTPNAAAEAVEHCIAATQPGCHDTMNAILHRGIDGHLQHQRQDFAGLATNLNSILAHFKPA